MGAVDAILTRYQVDAVQAVDETRRLTEAEQGLDTRGGSLNRQFSNLEQSLLGYRREQTQQQRTAGFLAREFGEIANAAGLSGKALDGVSRLFVEGVAGGLGFGIALEAVKIGLGLLSDEFQESSKRNAEALARTRKAFDDTFRSVQALGHALDSQFGLPLRATEKAIQQVAEETHAALVKQQRVIEDTPRHNIWTGTWSDTKEWKAAVAEGERIWQDGQERMRRLAERGAGERMNLILEQLKAEEVAQLQRDAVNLGRLPVRNAKILQIRKKLEADLKALSNERDITEEARETRRVHLEKQADFDVFYARRELTNKLIDEQFRQGSITEEALRLETEQQAQVRLQLQEIAAQKERRIFEETARREEMVLQHLGVATAKYTQEAVTAYLRLSRVKGADANAEKQRQDLIMAGLDALGNAIQDFTKANIEALAKEAAVEGIVNTAKALASLGLAFLGVPGAGAAAEAYFAAAAVDFSVAGVAAGVGAAMSGGRGGGGGGGPSPDLGGGTQGAGGTGSSEQGKPAPTINLYFSGRALMTPAEVKRELADLLKETRQSGFMEG